MLSWDPQSGDPLNRVSPVAPDPGVVGSHDVERERGIFRDPPTDGGRLHKLRLAKCLVGAEALPVELPAFGLRLLDVASERRGFSLVFGVEDPTFKVIYPTRTDAEPRVEMLIAAPSHLREVAEKIGHRLTKAFTPDKRDEAVVIAKALRDAPASLPIRHFRQMVLGTDRGLVRTGFRCNQDCGLCWQGRDWRTHPPAQIRLWIEDLYRAGCRTLILSGGEPTIDRSFFEYVEWAVEVGFKAVEIETNAIQLGRTDLARRLAALPSVSLFVSLHSADPTISDSATNAPGTFRRTVAGIHAALDAGLPVLLNAVMTAETLPVMSDLPVFVREEFGTRPGVRSLMISSVQHPFGEGLDVELIPHPSQVRRFLPGIIDAAVRVGLPLSGVDGPCGPPLCAHGADPRATDLSPISEPLPWRVYPPVCDGCEVRNACFGVTEDHFQRFGSDAAAPIQRN